MPKRLILALAFAIALASPAARTSAADTHAPAGEGRAPAETVSHPEGGGASPAAGHDEHAKPGLLDINFFSALWVVIIFIVLLVILYPTAWKNVLAGLKAREQRIRQDIADAEAARAKAEATLREYQNQLATAEQKVRDMISAATAQGEQVANNIRTRAEQEAQDIKDRSLREIDSARKQALAEIYEQAATLSTSIAEKIIRRNLNPEDQRDLVQRSLEELQTVGNR
jgi:F-type H+-transporting ATPase subunit b